MLIARGDHERVVNCFIDASGRTVFTHTDPGIVFPVMGLGTGFTDTLPGTGFTDTHPGTVFTDTDPGTAFTVTNPGTVFTVSDPGSFHLRTRVQVSQIQTRVQVSRTGFSTLTRRLTGLLGFAGV